MCIVCSPTSRSFHKVCALKTKGSPKSCCPEYFYKNTFYSVACTNLSVFKIWALQRVLNSSCFVVIGGHVKVSDTKSEGGEGSEAGEGVMATVMEEEEGKGEMEAEGEESDKSDNEEAICPICLNELDEGEDLLVCSSCHNHLHQHCMDICK